MVDKMFKLSFVIISIAIITLPLNCSGPLSERRSDKDSSMGMISQRINYHISWQDAVDEIKGVRGQVVKWSGYIVKAAENNIQISSRMELKKRRQPDGTPNLEPIIEVIPIDRNNWKNYNYFDNFVFLLDHPLPRETRLGDMTQTVAVWDAVFVIGEIVDLQTIVSVSGSNIIVPVLKGYALAKANDHNFNHPIWISDSY